MTTPGEGLFRYNNPTVVSVAAVAAQDYFFVDWTGSAVAARKIADANVASTTVTVDAGYTLQANFDTNKHSLTVSSTGGGSVTNPGEGTFLYDNVNVVPISITATPIANSNFANWTGTAVSAGKVADPTSTNTTVTPDADYTLVANFSIVQHNLTTSSNVGGSVSTPGEGTYAYDHGAAASVSASPSANYHFVNWTGTAVSSGKVGNANLASTTITMDAAYTIQANFAIDQHTLTTSSTSGGSVSSPGEGSFLYDGGTGVPIQAVAGNNYFFVNWTGTAVSAGRVANPSAASTTVTVDAGYTVRANFGQQDGVAPTIANLSPASGSIQAPLDSLVILHVTDAGIGVEAGTVQIELDGTVIYTGDVSSYNSAGGTCRRTGTPADYTYAYQSNAVFDFDDLKTVTVNAADIGGVAMAQQSYSFRTEMRSFGQNKQVNSGLGLDNLDNGSTVTVRDINGNIWAVWHAGPVGSRDIYLGKLTAGATTFDTSVRLTTSSADQVNPAIASSRGRLYVVWQDNSRGDWDIWGTTSANWSNHQRIADSDPNQHFNQVNPAVAVDGRNPMHAYVVWQDDRAGNHDIYIAESSDTFITNTITPVTSHTSDQMSPAIAVDSSNTVYVLWTDARNSANGTDVYGASGSPWTNVPVVSKAANQSRPQIAVESAGSVLHMLWVDQISGNGDIYYDYSTGLPGSPLAGSNLVDDTVSAVQLSPTLAVTGTGAGLKVFASWQDSRNISGGTGDLDLYMVQTNSGSGTNVFVGDGGTNSDQTEPAMGVDQYGYPYVVWTDDRGTNDGIYHAGSTRMQSTPLLSGVID
ncbi:MAG: InlB B-repeat-containing protein, partial [Planctomycetota bacterium]